MSQRSAIVACLRRLNFPILNCPFLIFSANSMPPIITTALSNSLQTEHRSKPIISLGDDPLDKLFKYWFDRTFTRLGNSPASFISRTARMRSLVGVQRDLRWCTR
jgi:hypothetical protein